MSEYIYATDGDTVQNMLSDVFEPLQEIVRCRDCEHRYDNQCGRYPDWFDIELDGFCKWGERRQP